MIMHPPAPHILKSHHARITCTVCHVLIATCACLDECFDVDGLWIERAELSQTCAVCAAIARRA